MSPKRPQRFWPLVQIAPRQYKARPAPDRQAGCLQAIMWPDADICPDPMVYARLGEGVMFADDFRSLSFDAEATVTFDTAFNLFPLGKWHRHCDLEDLRLALRGKGAFELSVTCVRPHWRPDLVLLAQVVVLAAGQDLRLDLSKRIKGHEDGVLYFSLRARERGAEFHGAEWHTAQAPKREPELCLVITTFKREAAVLASAARFAAFVEQSAARNHLRLLVIDNGQTVDLPPCDKVTLVRNRNLGGAGGFARGMQEAAALGATHCLFMDDDASVHMAAVDRVWTFLAHATDIATAVNGGLTQAIAPTKIWESGAVIFQFCRPLFRDVDLTKRNDVVGMEIATAGPNPSHYYGGFWFFAFAIAQVTHWPFPFFVRGDDINFSISNEFKFVSLPGVVSFQDQDFADKETSLTLYLDVRNHLIQHLTLPSLTVGVKTFAMIPAHFFYRSMVQSHHDSLWALCLSLEDVMKGPSFFAANADMAERRALINGRRRFEVWKPIEGGAPRARRRFNPDRGPAQRLMRYSFNGLLLPFFGLWGNRIVIQRSDRGNLMLARGAARITYIDEERRMAMTVRHRKLRTVVLGLRMTWNILKLALTYPALRAKWRRDFDGMTSQNFWQGQFAEAPPKPAE